MFKALCSTTWVWYLHSNAHDYELILISQQTTLSKVFCSNLAHLSLVFFWFTGMHLHGAYFSSYHCWLKDPKYSFPSAQSIWYFIGQDILNTKIGIYFQGVHITSGLFQLWRSEGIITNLALKDACCVSLIATILSLLGSSLHLHLIWLEISLYKKSKSFSIHHSISLFGLGSISFSRHQIHISAPIHRLLLSGLDPMSMPCAQELLNLSKSSLHTASALEFDVILLPQGIITFHTHLCGSITLLRTNALYATTLTSNSSILGSSGKLLTNGSVLLGQVITHHLYLGVVCLSSSVLGFRLRFYFTYTSASYMQLLSWNAQLSMNLAIAGS